MSEYMRGFADIYFTAYRIMEKQRNMGFPSNEGILFERVEDGN